MTERPRIRWAQGGRPCTGEARSGDLSVVSEDADRLTVALLDVAGHGDPAADVADAMREPLRRRLADDHTEIMRWAHRTLNGTRGGSLGIATFDLRTRTLWWTATGNVRCRAIGGGLLLSRDGLLGARLPMPRPNQAPLEPGATWLIATDGLLRSAGDTPCTWRNPEEEVHRLLLTHSRPHDDATCVVVLVPP